MSQWICAVTLLLATSAQAQEETYVQVGLLVGGVAGILCVGAVCIYGAYRLSQTIKTRETQTRLKVRNERRERLGLSKLTSTKSRIASSVTSSV